MRSLRFHKHFYKLRTLQGVIEAFSEVARFTLSRDGQHHVVTLESVLDGDAADDSVRDLMGAFQNFALGSAIRERTA